jgi:endonuclease/exonuclease/phosphatase family metal-dependent hydrolase
VAPKDLPDPGNGTGVLTLNLANGQERGGYRSPEGRERQAELIRETGATIAAFQEVDTNVDRSGNANTSLDVVRRINPAFDVFTSGTSVPTVPIGADAPETALRKGSDGTTLYQTPQGTLVTGESFSGDDRGGLGDSGADATYGNALYVGAPNKVVDAYTVELPPTPGGDGPPVASPEELANLADGKLTDADRDALGQRNEAIRKGSPIEPRSALVTRVVGPDGRERSIITTHLSKNGDKELRARQLAYLAQVAQAESKGPPAREVMVLGDFNSSTKEVGAALEGAGLHRVVGGKKETEANFDQIWVSGGTPTDTSAQVEAGRASDHKYAGYTVIR